MRGWVILLLILAAAVAATWAAPLLIEDPGYVLIRFQGWSLETSALLLVVLLLLAVALLFGALTLLRAPARLAGRRARRRLENGLLHLAEGHKQRAEKLLAGAAKASGMRRAGFLAAARAACGPEADARREQYLQRVDDGTARSRFLVELTRAAALIDAGRCADAVPGLEKLRRRHRGHRRVLRLLSHCYRELGDWRKLRALAPVLRRQQLIDSDGAGDRGVMAVGQQIGQASDRSELAAAWKSAGRAERRDPRVVHAYAERACALGARREAIKALEKALDRAADRSLLRLYGDCMEGADQRRLSKAETWRRREPDNPDVELLLGRLCMQGELWGKAREHLLESLRLEPRRESYELLGSLMERQGELQVAAACYANALNLDSGAALRELPTPSGWHRPGGLTDDSGRRTLSDQASSDDSGADSELDSEAGSATPSSPADAEDVRGAKSNES